MTKTILLSVLAAAIFLSTAILIAQEQAPAPTFKEGDTWQFNIVPKGQLGKSTDQNEGMHELTVTQGVVKLYKISGGQRNEQPVQPAGPTQALFRLVGKSDLRQDLKFPLSLGQKWTYEYVTRLPASKFDARRYAEVDVVGMEQVTTPAGSFKAYKLIKNERSTSGGRF